jgi:hypothetical protein
MGSLPFVGRAAELAALEELARSAFAGRAQLALVTGEPGIGKTRLIEEVESRVRDVATIAWSRAWEVGGAPTYWLWAQVLRNLATHPGWPAAIGAAQRDVLAPIDPFSFGEAPAAEGEQARFRLFSAVGALLADLARTRPLLIVIDDAHAADLPSLLLLRFLLRELRNARVLFIATQRSTQANPPEEVAALLASLARDARTLALTGLSSAEIEELVERARGRPSSALARSLHEATSGNAFFLVEMLGSGGPIPHAVREAIARQLATLDHDTRRLLSAAAVLGRAATVPLLCGLSSLSSDVVLASLDRAARERILRESDDGRWSFAHALFRETIYVELTPRQRIEQHRRTAHVLEDQVTHVTELARHWAACASETDEIARAIATTRVAAEHSTRLAAHADAVRHYETLLRFDDSVATRLSLGHAQIAAGRRADAAKTFEHVLRSTDGRAFAEAAIGYARTVEFVTVDPHAIQQLERAERLVQTRDALRVRVLSQLAMSLWLSADASQRRREVARAAVDLAREVDDPKLIALALNARIQASHDPDGIRERLAAADEIVELAIAIDDEERHAEGLRWRWGARVELAEVTRADPDLELHERIAESLKIPHILINAAMRRGLRATLAGDLVAADRAIERMFAIGTDVGDPMNELVHACMRSVLAMFRDDRDALAATVPALRSFASRIHWGVFVRARLAQVLARLGEHDEARREAELVGSVDRIPFDFVYLSTLALLGETAVLVGMRPLAASVHERLAPYSDRHIVTGAAMTLGPAARTLALCERMMGRDPGKRFEEAIHVARKMESPPWLAHIEREMGRRPVATSEPVVLARNGDHWVLRAHGRSHTLKHRKGFDHLAQLVNGGGELHVLELAGADRSAAQSADAVLDSRAKAAYRARIEDLRERERDAEERGDRRGVERVRGEIDAIAEELARSLGLGGRDRRASANADRARSAVTLAIRRAIDAITAVDAVVGGHLDRAVKTGLLCAYQPDPTATIVVRVTS